ncbi:MAG: LPS assembly protein LptD [Porticoccaceae bacterium]|nr:LPS assembly protein LptD [Porticoccaceae bacterium]
MLTRINHYFLSTLAITFGLSDSVFTAEISSAPYNFEAQSTPIKHNLDWVQAADMTPQQRQQYGNKACGAFIEPRREQADNDLDIQDAPLRVTANSTKASSDKVAVLEGDVQISQGSRQIKSDFATIDQNAQKVTLKGNVEFREPGILLKGEDAGIDVANSNVTINNATYVIHQASIRGAAKKLSKSDQGNIIIDEASYSTCEPGDSSWQLITKQIEIDQKSGWATIKNARFEIKDIPIFYFPYIKFPIDDRRSSGLLIPDIDINQDNGLDIAQPIYWNIAENYDSTISPRYIQHRGFGIEADFRLLNSWSQSRVSGSFLGNDKGGDDADEINPITGLHPYEGDDRYMLNLDHVGGIDRPWSTFVDYNSVSDTDYVRDLGNMTIDETSQTHIKQRAYARYETNHWNYQITSEDYQSVTRGLTDQYSILPSIDVDGYYRFDNNLVLNLSNRYTVFSHNNPNKVEGSRRRLDYSLTWDQHWNWGYFKPKVELKHLAYNLNYPSQIRPMGVDQNPEVTIPVYSFDTGIFFERSLNWLDGVTQTFEPRLMYLHSGYKDQSVLPDFDTREFTPSYDLLFRDTRFVGGDRISDDQRLTLGITTKLIDPNSGQEKFRASIAQSVYYADRKIMLSTIPTAEELAGMGRDRSAIALEVAARITNNWRFTSDLVYDDLDNHLEKTGFSARYNDRKKRIFNFTYRYTRRTARAYDGQLIDQNIKQTNISGLVPLTANLNLVGRWNHDFTNNRELEVFAGFEYHNCCWRTSLFAYRSLRRDDELLFPEEELKARNGFAFKIEFKGLGGSGNRVDKMLNNGIYGYEHDETF